MLAKEQSIELMRGVDVSNVADGCRNAALHFLRGVDAGWGKRELAHWLLGPYHRLSMLRLSGTTPARSTSGFFPRATANGPVSDGDVQRVMREAQEAVLGIVSRFENGDPRVDTFIWRLQSRGIFERVVDGNGTRGLVPNESISQHLSERVLSLIAVDYVARPLDYEDRVTICRTCGDVSFSEHARARGNCGAHDADRSGPQLRSTIEADPEIEFQELDLDAADIDDVEVMRMVAQL
ncbi:MAG: hypothetical protein ABI183_09320 [Polyangiaceae bacterium]